MSTYNELYARLTATDFIIYLTANKFDPYKRVAVYRNLNGTTGLVNAAVLAALGINRRDLPTIVPASRLVEAFKRCHVGNVLWKYIDLGISIGGGGGEGSSPGTEQPSTPSGNVFSFRGSVLNYNDLPNSGNSVGDVYQVAGEEYTEYVWIEKTDGTFGWDQLGRSVNLQDYATAESVASVEERINRVSSYTAFEVYAKGSAIAVGETDPNLGGNGTISNEAIPACRTHRMKICTAQTDIAKSDVVIDWGDGARSVIADGGYVTTSVNTAGNVREYTVEHTYEQDGKYIVKIFGCQYFNICTPDGNESDAKKYNLICRVFDNDLPLATNVTNISSFCAYAIRLLSVHVPPYYNFSNCINISGVFHDCRNLQSVKGLENQFLVINEGAQVFDNCDAITDLEFTIPVVVSRGQLNGMFNNLSSFAGDIAKLIPAGGFLGGTLDATGLFNGCANLTGRVPAEQFWDNKKVKWINTSTAFTGCHADIRAQVPVSWGGTLPDNEINNGSDAKAAIISGGTEASPVELNLKAGKIYLAESPFTATLPEAPEVGTIIRIACIEGQENMKIYPGGFDTIAGSSNPCIIGVTDDGSFVNNEFCQFIYLPGNWILF